MGEGGDGAAGGTDGIPFDAEDAIAILERTPGVLRTLLSGLGERWIHASEGPGTFSPHEVLGHLIHGERTDWMPRLRLLLESGDERPFEPFDRFAHREAIRGRTAADLLDEFAGLRDDNLRELRELAVGDLDLSRPGLHPDLGPVDARQLLATWVVHDLAHVRQVCRVLAKQYGDEVGPWADYLRVLRE